MNIKILTILALVSSTIYIYYTVQKDKDELYQTLSVASDKISEHIVDEPTIKTIVKTTPIAEESKEIPEQRDIEEPIKQIIIEEKISISKQEIDVKKDINDEESLESMIAVALKGIKTSKIIKTEENQ